MNRYPKSIYIPNQASTLLDPFQIHWDHIAGDDFFIHVKKSISLVFSIQCVFIRWTDHKTLRVFL